MSSLGLNALVVRTILSILVLIGIGLTTGSFIYAQDFLRKYAVEVAHKTIDARASDSTIQSLRQIQKELVANQDVRKRINLLRSDDQFPEFRIVDEIQKIAKQNNIKIKSFSYQDSATAAATPSAPVNPGTQINNINEKTISLLVDLESPVNYKTFLEFMYDIEQHLPKMKVDGVSLTPGDTKDRVTVGQLTVEMYIK